jgi:hypothetical protein
MNPLFFVSAGVGNNGKSELVNSELIRGLGRYQLITALCRACRRVACVEQKSVSSTQIWFHNADTYEIESPPPRYVVSFSLVLVLVLVLVLLV